MASVALLESSFLKKPTISVQIGLKKNIEDPCIANQFGWLTMGKITKVPREGGGGAGASAKED